MASDQLRRRENNTNEREIHVEKDRVPKMATHFESLADKASSDQSDVTAAAGKQTPTMKERTVIVHEELKSPAAEKAAGRMNVSGMKAGETEEDRKKQKAQQFSKGSENQVQGSSRGGSNYNAIGKFEMTAGEEEKKKGTKSESREKGGEKPEQLSLEEISNLRATAQENAAKTIRAAEARAKASTNKGGEAKPNEGESKGKGGTLQGAQTAAVQAKDTILEGAKRTSQFISEKGGETKDTAAEKLQRGYGATKDTVASAGDTILPKAEQAKDYAVQKSKETKDIVAEKIKQGNDVTKDTVVSAGKTAVDYTKPKAEQAKDYSLQKTVEAKDTLVDVGKNTASYAGEKAAVTKDVTVEKSKGATEYAGKLAADVKDKAVAAGWSATHYVTEKATEGTRAAARVVEYTGHKVAEISAKPLEAAAAAGESVADYTARKKDDAYREVEAKKFTRTVDTEPLKNKGEQKQENLTTQAKEKVEEFTKPIGNQVKQTFQGSSGERQNRQDIESKEKPQRHGRQPRAEGETFQFQGSPEEMEGEETGVLGAIGETIAEIAQTTKELVIGPDPNQGVTDPSLKQAQAQAIEPNISSDHMK